MSARSVVSVVEANPAMRRAVVGWLQELGCEPVVRTEGSTLQTDGAANADMVCLGSGSSPRASVALLRSLRRSRPDLPVVVISDSSDLDEAVEAMRAGAVDYLSLPIDRRRFVESVSRVLRQRRLAGRAGGVPRGYPELVGESRAMVSILRHVERIKHSDITVALIGETGTGKELVARAIHRAGARAHEPFVAINCAAIPTSLQEAELFGHEKGAFTGATSRRRGSFEQAHRGTLFLDELGEMSPSTQAALLRVLQERSVRRVGGCSEIPVDVRIISATSRDLEEEVAAGRFRKDLYYRLVVYPISLPPLRERREDIPALVEHLLSEANPPRGPVVRIAPDAMDALIRYDWPGNIRQLQNVLRRSTMLCDGPELQRYHLPGDLTGRPGHPPAPRETPLQPGPRSERKITPLRELERREILRALAATGGNVTKSAELLEIGRATLYRRISAEHIDLEETSTAVLAVDPVD